MGKKITRLTLFKIPDPADQRKLLDEYRDVAQKARKDGKPYILSLTAGPTFEDQRNQGFTIGVVTVFASQEDFDYYDTTCPAHNHLKALAKTLHQGMLMIYLESIFD